MSQRNERLKAELEQLRWREKATPSTVFAYLLAPASIRSPKGPPQTTIALSAGKAHLWMELYNNVYATYQVILQSVEGRKSSDAGPANSGSIGRSPRCRSMPETSPKAITS